MLATLETWRASLTKPSIAELVVVVCVVACLFGVGGRLYQRGRTICVLLAELCIIPQFRPDEAIDNHNGAMMMEFLSSSIVHTPRFSSSLQLLCNFHSNHAACQCTGCVQAMLVPNHAPNHRSGTTKRYVAYRGMRKRAWRLKLCE